jgi:hypothetical protein
MTQLDMRYLEDVVRLRNTVPADETDAADILAQFAAADAAVDVTDDDTPRPEIITARITQRSQFVGARLPDGRLVVWVRDIVPVDTPESTFESDDPGIAYVCDGDEDALLEDINRIWLRRSLADGAYRHFAGWRHLIVALIPEEVGAKESKVARTNLDGEIEITHTYNVLDAYGTYAAWLTELALGFGSGDDAIGFDRDLGLDGMTRSVVSAWLHREAATVQAAQARHSLQFTLAGLELIHRRGGEGAASMPSIAELARSFYTDRGNLSKVIAASKRDPEISDTLRQIAERN